MSTEESYDKGKEARKLLYSRFSGVLSTHSVEMDGYPFGSLTPFTLDRRGKPIILISNLAQHTKNIEDNSKVSLTIVEKPLSLQVQAYGRLTILAEAKKVEDDLYEDISSRYIDYFPSAKRYFEAHDFSFYELDVKTARFIGGFGKIFWISNTELLVENPFDRTQEESIVDHMNKDHAETMLKYMEGIFDIVVNNPNQLSMIGIDGEGFHIKYSNSIYRVEFEERVLDTEQARTQLVYLSRKFTKTTRSK